MQDKEPNYYRNKKRWDRIVSFLKTGAVILVFGGAAVYLALFLVNLIFRSGPPETSTEQQVEKMQQLEQQSSGEGGDNSSLLAGFTGEPETRSFDDSIPLTTATPDIAVTPLDEDGNPIGGNGGPGSGDSGPSPQLSGGGGESDTPDQQEAANQDQASDQSTRQGDNDPEPTPAQREARRFTEQQAERAAQNERGDQDQTDQSDSEDSASGQDTQQDSGSQSGAEQQQNEEDSGGEQETTDGGGDGQTGDQDEELQRYQLLTPPLSSRSRAEQQLGTAREIGFNGYLEEITDRGETKYRVEINERFSTYEAAKSARQRLEEAGIQVVLFKRGG